MSPKSWRSRPGVLGQSIRSVLHRALSCALAISLLAPSSQAWASASLLVADESPTLPPDIVILKSGGMVRGTISEYEPGKRVIIQTTAGEIREFSAQEFSYAGPASAGTTGGRSQPSAAPPTETSKLDVPSDAIGFEATSTSEKKDLALYVHLASASAVASNGVVVVASSYGLVCQAPCTQKMSPGDYQFRVVSQSSGSVALPQIYKLNGGETLRSDYHSNRPIRRAGLIIMLGGMIGGSILLGAGLAKIGGSSSIGKFDPDTGEWEEPEKKENNSLKLIYAGGAVMGIGTIVGLIMGLRRDRATLTVIPPNPSARPSGEAQEVDLAGWRPLRRSGARISQRL